METTTTRENPVMFCHDSTSIFYPTAPGRVYIIGIAALADCDGSDEDYSDSTSTGDMFDMLAGGGCSECGHERDRLTFIPRIALVKSIPGGWWPGNWPTTTRGVNDEGEEGIVEMSPQEVADDFADALESWADWCDRDSVRLDSFDEVMGAIERAA